MQWSPTRNLASLGVLVVVLCALTLLCGCRSPQRVRGEEAKKLAATFSFWQPHLLLTSDQRYRRLEVEIDHVEGTGPTAGELKAITDFFETHCRKPEGVRVRVDAPIPRARARGIGRKALAELHLDGPESADAAFAYFLFFDSRLAGTPKAEPITTRIPFPGAVLVDRRYLDAGTWFPGAGDVARRLILHEAGHVLGLCANQAHADGIHCTNSPCLMNATLHIRPLRLLLPGPVAPQRDFCSACRADLQATLASPPADNLRFLGPYCVRSESGYHVVSSPAFAFVHVGALADLDLADLKRRRHAKFNAEPQLDGIHIQTGLLDLSIARDLIPQLERDPLEALRDLAVNLKAKLADSEASPKEPKP